MLPTEASRKIRALGHELGFQRVGFARVDGPADPQDRLGDWLARGHHAGMSYMARTAAERADVRRVVPGARTVIAVAMSYHRPEYEPSPPLRVSRYAVGRDYHHVMRRRLRRMRKGVLQICPEADVKPTVDTSPVLEREWARRAGVGWIGKSTMSIAPDLGTYYFLGTLVTTAELAPDDPHPDRCGTCTRCLDACPTGAFVGPGQLDARRCITYWNVEDRETPRADLPELFGWLAGCDVCQEVCPWNKFAKPSTEPHFVPRAELARPAPEPLTRDPRYAERILDGTALKRTGAATLRRNALRILRGPADED